MIRFWSLLFLWLSSVHCLTVFRFWSFHPVLHLFSCCLAVRHFVLCRPVLSMATNRFSFRASTFLLAFISLSSSFSSSDRLLLFTSWLISLLTSLSITSFPVFCRLPSSHSFPSFLLHCVLRFDFIFSWIVFRPVVSTLVLSPLSPLLPLCPLSPEPLLRALLRLLFLHQSPLIVSEDQADFAGLGRPRQHLQKHGGLEAGQAGFNLWGKGRERLGVETAAEG